MPLIALTGLASRARCEDAALMRPCLIGCDGGELGLSAGAVATGGTGAEGSGRASHLDTSCCTLADRGARRERLDGRGGELPL